MSAAHPEQGPGLPEGQIGHLGSQPGRATRHRSPPPQQQAMGVVAVQGPHGGDAPLVRRHEQGTVGRARGSRGQERVFPACREEGGRGVEPRGRHVEVPVPVRGGDTSPRETEPARAPIARDGTLGTAVTVPRGPEPRRARVTGVLCAAV
eukprot:3932455-Rhodomonas_salina.3